MHNYKCGNCNKTKTLTNMILRFIEPKDPKRYGICRSCNNLMNRNDLNYLQELSKLKIS